MEETKEEEEVPEENLLHDLEQEAVTDLIENESTAPST